MYARVSARWARAVAFSSSVSPNSVVQSPKLPCVVPKLVLGGGLKARNSNAQAREAIIECHIPSRMAELARPESYAVMS